VLAPLIGNVFIVFSYVFRTVEKIGGPYSVATPSQTFSPYRETTALRPALGLSIEDLARRWVRVSPQHRGQRLP
jgi:hypothetical protein